MIERLCIIGAGLIGCEFANDLINGGFEVDVIDTTGCGDVFHAGFAYAMLQGAFWDSCLAFANAAAALKCRGRTGRARLPDRDEIWRLAGR